MSEGYEAVFESVRDWQMEGQPEILAGEGKSYWADFFWWGRSGEWLHSYIVEQTGIDPFIGSLKTFFQNMYLWLTQKWNKLQAWFAGLEAFIQFLWQNLNDTIRDFRSWIWVRFEGLINLIWNTFTLLFWELTAALGTFFDKIVAPVREIWVQITETLRDWFEKIQAAIAAFLSDPMQWALDLGASIWESLESLGALIWNAMIDAANVAADWFGERIAVLAPQVIEYLRDVIVWFWDLIRDAFVFVRDQIVPAVAGATSGALGFLKDQFTHLMSLAYKEIEDFVGSFVPMTPEKAPRLAALMFGSAVGMGALAHGIALSVEAIPNIKYMGVHYLSAFAARMGSFGTIAGATMGVMAAVSLRRPFTYYLQSLMRPMQPRSGDLMMMAVKPDIPPEVFKRGMAYEGYSDYWIGRFQATMYHEPRYFELSMMAEDAIASAEWLFTKARRSGYSEKDSKIFVSSIAKKAARTQRQDYYKQAFNLYKEGYIGRERFKTCLTHLEMRPEAMEYAIMGADFAYQYDLFRDLVSAYRTAFRRDLITEDEFSSSLSALGLEAERVDALVYIEWTRKTPSAVKAERKEIAKEWAAVQKEYSRIYIEAFRRGLIEEGQLAIYLIAIGVKEQVARATARYEALKKLPKPKYEEVGEEVLPPPPEPPKLLE